MKRFALLAGAALLAAALPVLAQDAGVKPEDAIKYRKGVMTAMSWQMRPLAAMVKGARPFDRAQFLKSAQAVAALSLLPYEGFTPGSDKGDTRALEKIFAERAKFDEAGKRFQEDAAKLVQAAQGTDENAMRNQFGAVAKHCSSCHDDFRRK